MEKTVQYLMDMRRDNEKLREQLATITSVRKENESLREQVPIYVIFNHNWKKKTAINNNYFHKEWIVQKRNRTVKIWSGPKFNNKGQFTKWNEINLQQLIFVNIIILKYTLSIFILFLIFCFCFCYIFFINKIHSVI